MNKNKAIIVNGKEWTEQDVLNNWNTSIAGHMKKVITFEDYLNFMYSNHGVDVTERKIAVNPIVEVREHGVDTLREKLTALELKEILFIIKDHGYDPFKQLTKCQKKDKKYLVNFLVERALNLSKLGQVFRTCESKESGGLK